VPDEELLTLIRERSADFVVLEANPLDDIANSRRIDTVYLRGRRVDREALKTRWQAAFPRSVAGHD
jgi:hypothetical protein